jgi:hypothetical protein
MSRRDEMCDDWISVREEKGPEALLQARVGRGAPPVLTHVLVPARHNEGLDEPLSPVGVAVEGPAHGPVRRRARPTRRRAIWKASSDWGRTS